MNRLLIVTGASSGIGAAVVSAAREEASIATVSRRPGPGNHLAADLADPTVWPEVGSWIATLVSGEEWDWVGFVHCAATLDPMGPAAEVDSGAYARNVLLNSAAAQVLGQHFLRSMTSSVAEGVVCQVSSGAASTPYPGWSSYCAGKAAVDQWTRTVGIEQGHAGGRIRVMSVAPGVVDTDMQASIRSMPGDRFPNVDRFRRLHETGALADPAEVGRRLWQLMQRRDLDNGAVLDLRSV